MASDDSVHAISLLTWWRDLTTRLGHGGAQFLEWLLLADADPDVSVHVASKYPNQWEVPGSFELKVCVELFKNTRYAMAVIGMPLVGLTFILMPLLSNYFGTQTYQYGWVMTLAYIGGVVPAAVLAVVVVVAMVVAVVHLVVLAAVKVGDHTINRVEFRKFRRKKNAKKWSWSETFRYSTIAVLFFAFDVTVLITVNMVYVLQVQDNFSLVNTAAVQVILSLFKVGFNNLIIPVFLRSMLGEKGTRTFITSRLILYSINNIFIPCLATAITDPSCFLSAFTGNEPQFSITTYPLCESFSLQTGSCIETTLTGTATVNYVPPFTYTFECSSALITNYVPVLLYAYALNLLIVAIGPFLMASMPKSRVHRILINVLPGLLWPEHAEDGEGNLLRMDGIIANVMSNFITLFLFGIASPVLAFAVVVTAVLETYEWQVLYGRYLSQYSNRHSTSSISQVRGVTTDYYGLWNGVQNGVWVTVFSSGAFYCVITLDFLGQVDVHHQFANLVVPVLVFTTPPLLLLMDSIARKMEFFDTLYNNVREKSRNSLIADMRESWIRDSWLTRTATGGREPQADVNAIDEEVRMSQSNRNLSANKAGIALQARGATED